jgi:Ca2+-transporting ATPase
LVEEALLTGESVPVEKKSDTMHEAKTIGEQNNMLFAGTFILSGKAEGIVVAIGQKTYLGSIANLLAEAKVIKTPLQQQLARISKWIGIVVGLIILVVALIMLLQGAAWFEVLITGIALAVAAIPEGLPVAIMAILAIGMQRMLRKKALIRRMIAAETLGCVSVICTDKTGTLTQGKMFVTRVVTVKYDIKIDYSNLAALEISSEIKEMIQKCLHHGKKIVDGGAGAGALVDKAITQFASILQIQNSESDLGEMIDEIPFSSEKKYMATSHKLSTQSELLILVKGAPEKIFSMCKHNSALVEFEKKVIHMTSVDGLRVIAIATRLVNAGAELKESLNDLDCVGLIGLTDPLRANVNSTIKILNQAGIKLVLVTGDHKETALSIARQAGMRPRTHGVVTGVQMDNLGEDGLKKIAENTDVFARVDPMHKIAIVKAWQSHGNVVAMIGDGVNDAPALRNADMGVALGSGSDLAHEISDMVLLDNNLLTIADAVYEGRVIFDNFRKVLLYMLTHSLCEAAVILGALLLGFPLPLAVPQILWLNLLTDSFPCLALTLEPGEDSIMREAPRSKREHVVNKNLQKFMLVSTGVLSLSLLAFYSGLFFIFDDLTYIRSLLFTALVLDALMFSFVVQDLKKSGIGKRLFSNKWLLGSFAVGCCLQIIVLYVPAMQKMFSTSAISLIHWLIILCLSLIKFLILQFFKRFLLDIGVSACYHVAE